jgi:hypothetical protein
VINASALTIDISMYPLWVQQVSTTVIDTQLNPWPQTRESVTVSIPYAPLGGWNMEREANLRAIVMAYEREGYSVQPIRFQNNTAFRAIFRRNTQ